MGMLMNLAEQRARRTEFFRRTDSPFKRNQFGGSLEPDSQGPDFLLRGLRGTAPVSGRDSRGYVRRWRRERASFDGIGTGGSSRGAILGAFYPLPNAGTLKNGDIGIFTSRAAGTTENYSPQDRSQIFRAASISALTRRHSIVIQPTLLAEVSNVVVAAPVGHSARAAHFNRGC